MTVRITTDEMEIEAESVYDAYRLFVSLSDDYDTGLLLNSND